MRQAVGLMFVACSLTVVCHAVAQDQEHAAANVVAAEGFVDAFYSFDATKLKETLASAEESMPELSFYQGWAEGGHYEIVNRMPCQALSETEVSCSITVKDDLMSALGINFNVTDTFHLSFEKERIVSVRNTSNDLPVWEDAKAWVRQNRSELIAEPCTGYFNGGPTPGDCVRAMVQGFREFAASPAFPKTR